MMAQGLQQEEAPKLSVRMDGYQTETDYFVNILTKNIKNDDVHVEFGAENFRVRAKLSDGTVYTKHLHCANKIKPDNCSYEVMSTKLVIRLNKVESGIWPALEAQESLNKDIKPTYPSSSKKMTDWDKIESDIIRQEAEEPGEPFNVFKDIYESGDDNTKRAMIKSMQESGGTVLSTNWKTIGDKTTEICPPDGMEYKKWE